MTQKNDDHDEAESNPGDAEPHAPKRHAPIACFAALNALQADGSEDDGKDGSKAGERNDESTEQADEA